MLIKLLKQIVHDVTTASHLDEALSILVQRVSKAVEAPEVSVYLVDHKKSEFFLAASESAVKKTKTIQRYPLNKGLMGWICEQEEPLNLDNVQNHPAFMSETRLKPEDQHSILAVPIIQQRKVYGVICAERSEQKCFDDAEEALLITLAVQLGGMLAHGEATGELTQLIYREQQASQGAQSPQIFLSGIGSVPGVAIGTAVVVYPPADLDAVPHLHISDTVKEIAIFYQALQSVHEEMQRLSRRMKNTLPENEHALFDVYIRLLEKDYLGAEVAEKIESEKLSAQAALAIVIQKHVLQFESIKDDYLRERSSDFRDLGHRILAELQSEQQVEIEYPKRTILIGEEITAAALAEVPEGQLAGIVAAKGSTNSHIAILARAMGIPVVMGVAGLHVEQVSKRAVVVDGYYGNVFVSPTKALLSEYKKLAQEEDELNRSLVSLRDKPAETIDNYRISLKVNTGLSMNAGLALSVGAEGVGLYRSEVPFMSRERFPTEDEQYTIYRQILKAFAPHSVTMRTLDIGGDKMLSYFPMEEDNPYLGWRGIRVTLDHPDLFLSQVRAMMRANIGLHNLRIMLPMVSRVAEVEQALSLINQAHTELTQELGSLERPPVGLMIEVPSAVFLAKELAKRVNFLSVGSNDLTQYLLAVDRNNSRVSSLYDPLHPAVLRSLLKVVEGGHAAGVEVSICGEMASDPLAVVLLLAMGFDCLSMSSFSLPRIKWVVRSFSLTQARKILAEVLSFEHSDEIRLYLQKALVDEGLGGLIRAGKT